MPVRLAVVSLMSAAVVCAPVGTAGRAYAEFTCPAVGALPAPPTTLPHYALTVRVSKGLREVRGNLSVRFTPDRATDRIVFRLWPNMPFLAGKGARLTVAKVKLNGAAIPVMRPNATTLVVSRSLSAGELAVTSMAWQLRLPSGTLDRLLGGSVARLGSFFPLLAWNPDEGWKTDPPSAIGWEAWTSPTSDFDVKVQAPRGLQVLASGERVAMGRWQAHAVRDFALAVGHFTVVRGDARAPGRVRLIVGVENGKTVLARRFLAWARAALEAHSRRFGPYPWSSFTLVGMDMGHFSFEYPTLVFESTTDPTPRQGTAHELAHQWFYSLVGNNQWRDPWLDEALATWGQARSSGTLSDVIATPIAEAAKGKIGEPMSFWDQFDIRVFVDGLYAQGVQALASLAELEVVDCALRHYVATNAYRTAAPGDLLRALEMFVPNARQQLAAYGARF